MQPRLVHRYDHRLLSVVYPVAHGAADLLKNKEVKLYHEAVLFGDRDKVAGGYEAEVGTVPADKRLCALDIAGAQTVFRLEVALEFPALQRCGHDVLVVLFAQRLIADRAVVERN